MLTEENIANRKLGIGASEAGIVMGLNKYVSPYDLWRIKTGQAEAEDVSDKPAVHWGNVHEETIAQEYARVMGVKVHTVPETLYHPEYSYMLCHLDRKIADAPKILECKFACFHGDDWGPHGSDIVPLAYMIQVQYQMAITGYREADLAVLISGFDFRIYHFTYDEQLIARILTAVKSFWQCVTDKVSPELRDRSDVEIAYPFGNGFKEVDAETLEVIAKLKIIKADMRMYESEKEELENKLTLFLKGAEGVQSDTQVLATWKADKNGTRRLKIIGG